MSPRLKLHHPTNRSPSAHHSSLLTKHSRRPNVPLRPRFQQHPMPAFLASYGVSLLQLQLGAALTALVWCGGACDVCGGIGVGV